MATNNEIEFKQLLTQSQYQSIYKTYFQDVGTFSQTNYYIDTPQFDLKANQSALRIRVKDDYNEMTLKIPAEVGLMEYNFETRVVPELNKSITTQMLPAEIIEQLEKMDFDLNQLVILGALTTERLEKEVNGNLLVLDKSRYLAFEDFELEFEVDDYDEGFKQFKNILEQFNMQHEIPDNKVQRFFKRKSNLSGN
ncbi:MULTISPECIES: CYTH domain-containing protein [Staphylococcus]|uniref:Adenylate cyclase n=2 Tax=Staphylococcus saprophyticus TaxID=29385 RepID=A0A380HPJ8_STASA|nr:MULTISPECIES: CYTH domain-containing protein [Staphylococcus]MBF2752478.1 CYTH domain-containing protein [Staphylococcus saprophyticus]MBF2780987.1 CYTH domain-containing protein [Staphylococcus saprophyticus]MBN6091946.1 CYTH domain-containing protein [Staphylococcus saprophyticus]MDT3920139.1 CYTH domain-containing protein [Staphylococcus saprophyticus]MDT3923982.1 CYTH domain-containing protein [Staphylococcus saprophyticus]